MARRKRSVNAGWDWKRLAYIGLVLTSGSGGFGGYMLKDHPVLADMIQTVLGTMANGGDPADVNLAGQLKQVLAKTTAFQKAGTFAVTVSSIGIGALDVSRAPRVEVSVRTVDPRGVEAEIWGGDARPASRDPVDGNWSVNWADESFEVDWAPGQRIAVAVTAWTGLRRSTKLYMVNGHGPGFPLRPGAYDLRDDSQTAAAVDADAPKRRIVFQATRLPEAGATAAPERTARAPGRNGSISIQ